MSLAAMVLAEPGVPAKSVVGSQAGIITDNMHGQTRIVDLTPERLKAALNEGSV